MLDLFLVACFTAFFLAVLEYLIDVIAITTGPAFINTVASLSVSTLGAYLAGYAFDKKILLVIPAAAFLGRVFLKTTEKIVAYRPAVVNSARQ